MITLAVRSGVVILTGYPETPEDKELIPLGARLAPDHRSGGMLASKHRDGPKVSGP
jgi:hypothetical protein